MEITQETAAQHTPGPWKVGRKDRFLGQAFIEARGDDAPVAATFFLDVARPAAEVGANARLIAAAPDLLSALTELLAAIADPALGPDDGLALEATYRAAVNRRDAAVGNARAVLQATGG